MNTDFTSSDNNSIYLKAAALWLKTKSNTYPLREAVGRERGRGRLLLVQPGCSWKTQISISRCKCNDLCKAFKKKCKCTVCDTYYQAPKTPLCKPHMDIYKDSAKSPNLTSPKYFADTSPRRASGHWYLQKCMIAYCFPQSAVGHFKTNESHEKHWNDLSTVTRNEVVNLNIPTEPHFCLKAWLKSPWKGERKDTLSPFQRWNVSWISRYSYKVTYHLTHP